MTAVAARSGLTGRQPASSWRIRAMKSSCERSATGCAAGRYWSKYAPRTKRGSCAARCADWPISSSSRIDRSTAPSTCHAKCLSGPISAQISSSQRLVVCSVLSKTSRPVVAIAFASIDCLRTWPLRALSTAFGFGALLGRRHVTPMHLRRGRGRLHGCERLQYPVTVPGARGHQPGIARLQPHRLPLKVELGATGNNVADGLVIPFSDRRRLRLFVLPQPHRYALARGEIHLPHVAARRCPAADLLDSSIWRHGSYSRLTAPRCRFPLKMKPFSPSPRSGERTLAPSAKESQHGPWDRGRPARI